MILPIPLSFGSLTLPTRYLLSPLAGFTNLPFRRVVRELGGLGLATTDLVSARALLAGSAKSMQLIASCPKDRPFSVQIFGSEIPVMQEAAQLLEARGVDSIDINMGCPVARVTTGGAGAAMMCRPSDTIALVQAVVEAVKVPVTVKMRLGWDDTQITAPQFARDFEGVGVAAVMIHGRTREQGFRGVVSRAGIREVVAAVRRIPVIGNGDIRNLADAQTMFRETGCHGISIGRGALANPWIFQQLVAEETGQLLPPSGQFEDRLELLRRQLGFLEEQVGADHAVVQFRKMGHWYLKGMRVGSHLRNAFQTARTRSELEAVIAEIRQTGPATGNRNALPDMTIPVPSGPVERW